MATSSTINPSTSTSPSPCPTEPEASSTINPSTSTSPSPGPTEASSTTNPSTSTSPSPAPTEASSSSSCSSTFHSYLLKQNFGQLLRSAMAFGVSEVGVVGAKRIADLSLFGNQGTTGHCNFRFFDSLADAQRYYHKPSAEGGPGADICGIEISNESRAILEVVEEDASRREDGGADQSDGPKASAGANQSDGAATSSTRDLDSFNLLTCRTPFRKSTCFMLGNEGAGMSVQQLRICDFLVHIPQYSAATASLNVAVAGSIVLHHFALFARFQPHTICGEKFEVAAPRSKVERFQNPNENEREEIERKRLARKKQTEQDCGEEVGEEEFDLDVANEDMNEQARTLCRKGGA
ncbi:unnamed protein product [Amoebophrya sp. A25]|nr:unnamed protein product [Amoebophrya sp. A25]|eukprot:GSA25T00012324001.1